MTSCIAFYPCRDIDETDAFYTGVIGLERIFGDASSRIYSCGRGHFGFVRYADGQAATGRLCLSLNCRDRAGVDAHYARIVAARGTPEGAPAMHPNHPVYSFFIRDPNGYLVEFQKLDHLDI